MRLSAFGWQRVHRGKGHVCSLSHQKGLAESWQSQWANMLMQSQPYWRELWVVCWRMQGEMGIWRLCPNHMGPPFTTVIFLSRVRAHSGDRCFSRHLYCSFLSSWVKQAMLILTQRVSVQSQVGREDLSSVMQNMSRPNKCDRHWRRKRTYWCTVTSSEKQKHCVVSKLWTLKLSSYCKTSYFSPLLKFGPQKR